MAPPAERWYRRLLTLYPHGFRSRFGDGMRYAFRADFEAARAAGGVAVVWFWLQTVGQTLAGAFVARWPRLETRQPLAGAMTPRSRRRPMRSMFVVDLRDAWRALRAAPLVSTVAALSLALGIGANTALFSIVDTLMLKSLPVREADRLVILDDGSWTNPIWESIRDRQDDLVEGAFAWSTTRFNIAGRGEGQFVDGLWASGRMFDVLGVPAVIGRTFGPADDVRGGGPAGPVAVLGYDFWQRRFEGDPDVVGRALLLGGVSYTIVGVTPRSFFGLEVGRRFDVAVPIGTEPLQRGTASVLDRRSNWWLSVMARLRPGQTPEAATERLVAIQSLIRAETLPEDWTASLQARYLDTPLAFVPAASGTSGLRDRYQSALTALMVVVALVLLIACGNIANLLLARASARRHEFSVRLALGASRWRVARQLLAESVLLAAVGAALGLLFARWSAPMLVRQLASGTSAASLDLGTDWRVVGFTLAVAALTTLVFGLAPAFGAGRAAPNEALKTQGRTVAGDGRFTLRNALVVLQVAMSLALVVAAALFAQTFGRLATLDVGFDRKPLLVVSASAPPDRVPAETRLDLFTRLRDAAGGVPGVAAATASFVTPVSGSAWNTQIEIPNGPEIHVDDSLPMVNYVLPGWFGTYGTPILRGRDLDDRDTTGAPRVVVVNEAFVRRFFPDGEALGRTVIEPSFTAGGERKVHRVVGVVRDAVYRRLREPVPPTMYMSIAQYGDPPGASIAITVRAAAGSPSQLTRDLVSALGQVEPSLTLVFREIADQIDASLAQERLVALLSGFFGGLALLLAGLGLYGVTAYSVNQRRREIGVRLALGARSSGVLGLVLGRVAWLVGLGVVGGAALSIWGVGFVDALVYGLPARDPRTFVIAAVVLALVGGAAGWLPARRAARLDPAHVLREG